MERSPCPNCGAPNLATDLQCLTCGAALRASPAVAPPPELEADDAELSPPATGVRAWFDLATDAGQRRTALASGIVMLACLAYLMPGMLMLFGGLVPGVLLLGWFMEARDRAQDRAFVEGVKRGGGDKVAVQAELARLHRPDRVVRIGGRLPVSVKGFDSRLDSDKSDDKAR